VEKERYKMTKREFMNAIAAGTITEEAMAYAAAEIEKMNAANEARKNKPSKKALENAPLVDKIVNEILGEEPITATVIAEALDVKVQKASALARIAVKEGRAVAVDVKIKGKGTQKGYTKA